MWTLSLSWPQSSCGSDRRWGCRNSAVLVFVVVVCGRGSGGRCPCRGGMPKSKGRRNNAGSASRSSPCHQPCWSWSSVTSTNALGRRVGKLQMALGEPVSVQRGNEKNETENDSHCPYFSAQQPGCIHVLWTRGLRRLGSAMLRAAVGELPGGIEE